MKKAKNFREATTHLKEEALRRYRLKHQNDQEYQSSENDEKSPSEVKGKGDNSDKSESIDSEIPETYDYVPYHKEIADSADVPKKESEGKRTPEFKKTDDVPSQNIMKQVSPDATKDDTDKTGALEKPKDISEDVTGPNEVVEERPIASPITQLATDTKHYQDTKQPDEKEQKDEIVVPEKQKEQDEKYDLNMDQKSSSVDEEIIRPSLVEEKNEIPKSPEASQDNQEQILQTSDSQSAEEEKSNKIIKGKQNMKQEKGDQSLRGTETKDIEILITADETSKQDGKRIKSPKGKKSPLLRDETKTEWEWDGQQYTKNKDLPLQESPVQETPMTNTVSSDVQSGVDSQGGIPIMHLADFTSLSNISLLFNGHHSWLYTYRILIHMLYFFSCLLSIYRIFLRSRLFLCFRGIACVCLLVHVN